MSIENINHICINCMREKPDDGVCPFCGFDETQYFNPSALPPRTILAGKFLTGRAIAWSGFANTYLALDLNLDLKLAIKEYFPNRIVYRQSELSNAAILFSEEDAALFREAKAAFVAEAKLLTKHYSLPGIVSARDVFSENGTAYFVMEYVEGESLKHLFTQSEGKLPAAAFLELIRPLIRSLAKVHASGLIHREITPENIIITPTNSVKLIGFCSHPIYSETRTYGVPLAPSSSYTPLEIDSPDLAIGTWTDVYALCAVAYRAMTGADLQKASLRQLKDDMVAPNLLGAGLSSAQQSALLRGLAVFPDERWQTMDQLYTALYDSPQVTLSDVTTAKSVAPLPAISPAKPEKKNPTLEIVKPEERKHRAEEKHAVHKKQRQKPDRAQPSEQPKKPERKHWIRQRWLRILILLVAGLALFVLIGGVLIPSLPRKEELERDAFGISKWSQEQALQKLVYPDMPNFSAKQIRERLELLRSDYVLVTQYTKDEANNDVVAAKTIGHVETSSGYITTKAAPVVRIDHASATFFAGDAVFDVTVLGTEPVTGMMVLKLPITFEWFSWTFPTSETEPYLLSLQYLADKGKPKLTLLAEEVVKTEHTLKIGETEYAVLETKSETPVEPGSAYLYDLSFIGGFALDATLFEGAKADTTTRYWLGADGINAIVMDLARNADPDYPDIGIQGHTLKDGESPYSDYPLGVIIDFVVEGSPADRAGVKAGDIIAGYDLYHGDLSRLDQLELTQMKRSIVGESEQYKIVHDGELKTYSIAPGSRGDYFPIR